MNIYTHFALFFFTFLEFVTAQRNPQIVYVSPDKTINIGGTVNLECSVQFARQYPVLWVKIDPYAEGAALPISTDSTVIIRDNRFSLRYDMASSTYTLQIKDVQATDAGQYQCQVVINVNNKITEDVKIYIQIPPVIADNSTRSERVGENVPLRLQCFASGFPEPRIYWKRENNAILPTGGSVYEGNVLLISSVKKEDRGTYNCVADNGVGKPAIRSIRLAVEFAPSVMIPRPRIMQALNYDAELECHIEAFPPPVVTWVKDNRELSNSMGYAISKYTTSDEFTDSTLRVITVEKNQYGRYVCKAKNRLGSHEASTELSESYEPVCPPACISHASFLNTGSKITIVLLLTVLFL